MSTVTNTQQQQYDYKFRILVIGNLNVGIDSIIERYINNNFPTEKKFINSYDGKNKVILDSLTNKKVLVNVHGFPSRRFRSPNNSWYRDADGIIIVYDVTNKDSFNEIDTTHKRAVDQVTRDKTQVIVVGNKYDQILNNTQQQSIATETINQYCLLNSFDHFFISALTIHNISESFNHLISMIISKPPPSLPSHKDNKNNCIIS